MRKILLLFLVVLGFGCGGSSGGGNGNTASAFADRFARAISSSNPDQVAYLITNDFYDQCQDKQAFMDAYANDLAAGNDTTWTIEDVYDEQSQGDFISFLADIHERRYHNGVLKVDHTITWQFVIVDDGGVWRWYGDQSCPAGAKASGTIFGTDRKSSAPFNPAARRK